MDCHAGFADEGAHDGGAQAYGLAPIGGGFSFGEAVEAGDGFTEDACLAGGLPGRELVEIGVEIAHAAMGFHQQRGGAGKFRGGHAGADERVRNAAGIHHDRAALGIAAAVPGGIAARAEGGRRIGDGQAQRAAADLHADIGDGAHGAGHAHQGLVGGAREDDAEAAAGTPHAAAHGLAEAIDIIGNLGVRPGIFTDIGGVQRAGARGCDQVGAADGGDVRVRSGPGDRGDELARLALVIGDVRAFSATVIAGAGDEADALRVALQKKFVFGLQHVEIAEAAIIGGRIGEFAGAKRQADDIGLVGIDDPRKAGDDAAIGEIRDDGKTDRGPRRAGQRHLHIERGFVERIAASAAGAIDGVARGKLGDRPMGERSPAFMRENGGDVAIQHIAGHHYGDGGAAAVEQPRDLADGDFGFDGRVAIGLPQIVPPIGAGGAGAVQRIGRRGRGT